MCWKLEHFLTTLQMLNPCLSEQIVPQIKSEMKTVLIIAFLVVSKAFVEAINPKIKLRKVFSLKYFFYQYSSINQKDQFVNRKMTKKSSKLISI